MTQQELYERLAERIPSELSLAWDHDGLAVCPTDTRDVKKVLVALDATEAVITRAAREGFDTVVTHHPMLFQGVHEVNGATGAGRKILTAAANGIAVMCFHTRLDAVTGGVNDTLARLFTLKDSVPFGEGGIGRVGTLPSPMSLGDFCRLTKAVLGTPVVLAGDAHREVSRLALLGGSGKDEVALAVAAGADTYLSGRLDYHLLIDAPSFGVNLVEAGHYYTEVPVCGVLADWISEIIPEAEVVIHTDCEIICD